MHRSHIRLLPRELRDQIAAGEVIERPANVLKELVENSLDAGASQVDLRLDNGGQSLIRVADNGTGIAADELELAVTRHATSKISSMDDLWGIASYGFRGEALPSIASVAHLYIKSRPGPPPEENQSGQKKQPDPDLANSPEDPACHGGHCLTVEHGRILASSPCALSQGTVVEVRELFANVPARLKFLKSPSNELKRAQNWLARLSLARLETGFSLKAGEREALRFLPGQSLAARLGQIWPTNIASAMRPFSLERGGFRAHGLAAPPSLRMPRADRILLYVNGRAITDKRLMAAVREAYKGRLTSRDYPHALLFVELPPSEVDVNVHPAKSEVRFRDESAVFALALSALRQALEGAIFTAPNLNSEQADAWRQNANQASGLQSATSTQVQSQNEQYSQGQIHQPQGFWGVLDDPGLGLFAPKSAKPKKFWPETRNKHWNETAQDQDNKPQESAQAPAGSWTGFACRPQHLGVLNERIHPYGLEDAPSPWLDDPALAPAQDEKEEAPPSSSTWGSEVATPQAAAPPNRGLSYLGQVGESYLVLCDASGALLLLDQHAAHERVLYERLHRQGNAGQGQCLALAPTLTLGDGEISRWREIRPNLEALGFAFELAADLLRIMSIPSLLSRRDALDFLRQSLEGRKENLETLFISMACKAAVKAGMQLSLEEALALLEQWQNCAEPGHCPHGRPCVLRWDKADLERLFKRR